MTPHRPNPHRQDIWDNVEQELHTKLSTADAWHMAQNLGLYVAQNCGSTSPQKFIRQTFITAFGDDIGESKIKNRTRWIVLPTEVKGRVAQTLKNNEIAKSGGDFKKLAKVLLPRRSDYLAILVNGTSMEPPFLKGTASVNSGLELIESVCANISKKHNLMEYYESLIGFGIGLKSHDPSSTDVETISRAIPRIILNDAAWPNRGIKGSLAKVEKYKFPVGLSLSPEPSVYSDLDNVLPQMDEEYDFKVMALAPTIFLGDIYFPIPIFKVRLPNDLAVNKWSLERKNTSDEYSEEFKNKFCEFPFFNENCDEYDDFGDGIKFYDQDFKYDHVREKYDEWERLIRLQDRNYKVSFAVGYSPHRVLLMLLPNADGTKILPHILVTGDHIVSESSYTTVLSKTVKCHLYNGSRDVFLTDEGRTCFFATEDRSEWENDFSKFSSLIQTSFTASSPFGKSLLNQICVKEGAWLKDIGLNDLHDNYNPIFHPSFDYDTESFANTPPASIIGKLHRHLLSNEPEDCIFAELDNEAKLFTDNLNHFLKGHIQKKAQKEANLISYFE